MDEYDDELEEFKKYVLLLRCNVLYDHPPNIS